MGVRRLAALGLLVTAIGCHPGAIVDTTPKPQGVGGTIAGVVSASQRSVALSGRKVTAIDETSGARVSASTASNGGYSMQVPAGKYRLEVELRTGETLQTQPGTTQVNVGDLDSRRDFVIAVR